MNEITKYFKEELNKAVFEKQELDNKLKTIDIELDKLKQQEKDISLHEDDPDYVFLVDCFEKNMDEKVRSSIDERKDELEKSRKELEYQIDDICKQVEKYRHLYNLSNSNSPELNQEKLCNNIEFIIKLMDSDIQRAKIELTNLLKEEKKDAD